MFSLRSLVERLSRECVLKRRLPEDFGRAPILVSPDASLRFWKSRLESDLFDFAREFVAPGNVVWDIGANVGLFTLSAAQKAGASGRVVAVEADIWLARLLERSVAMQPSTSAAIQVLPAAVSDASGIASFAIAQRGRASNHLAGLPGWSQAGGLRESVDVVTVTLDWLLQFTPPPAVVKIDVEGAELKVLQGGSRLLSQIRPTILCEVSEQNPHQVTELLLANGYTLYDWDEPGRPHVTEAGINTLALPATG